MKALEKLSLQLSSLSKTFLKKSSLRVSNTYTHLISRQKVRPINYHMIPRISYLVDKKDYMPSTKHRVEDLVSELNKAKTEAVASERMNKWQEALANAKKNAVEGPTDNKLTEQEPTLDAVLPKSNKPKAQKKPKPAETVTSKEEPKVKKKSTSEPKAKKQTNKESQVNS